MAEPGCVHDAHFNNLEVSGSLDIDSVSPLNNTTFFNRMIGFMTGFKGSIASATGATITQANGVTGEAANDHTPAAEYTLVANAISTFNGTGAAPTLVNLPSATLGTFCVLKIGDDLSQGTDAVRIQTNVATDKFAQQYINVLHTNAPATAPSGGVMTAGTASSPTSVELIYTPADDNNTFLHTNSEIHFFCPVNGQWLVKVYGVSEGTGASGALTVA